MRLLSVGRRPRPNLDGWTERFRPFRKGKKKKKTEQSKETGGGVALLSNLDAGRLKKHPRRLCKVYLRQPIRPSRSRSLTSLPLPTAATLGGLNANNNASFQGMID